MRTGFAMAPLSLVFDQAGLKDVRAPVFPLVRYREISGADHYVFMAPCPEAMAEESQKLCTDAPGIDRVAAHTQIAEDAVAFFDARLK